MGLDRPAGEDNDIPYTRFVKVWLNLYHRVTIDDNRLDGYPFKVRVFDKILWIIGQPDYGDRHQRPLT
jgi:nucleoside-specific outer membrane channel protein Tsx